MRRVIFATFLTFAVSSVAKDNAGITSRDFIGDGLALVRDSRPCLAIRIETDETAVRIAAKNLLDDFERVTGHKPPETGDGQIVVRIDPALAAKRETYEMRVGADSIVIAGSDRRGAVYGIYELSEQIGVSPWHDWLDAPLPRHRQLYIKRGTYTNGEPAVRYRGIFLNDEAPCLTGWVKNTYGTDFGDHRFYERVGELILRLRGNFLWPAMWRWAFYADDPENSKTLADMGVIVGTSHHEPMARNHQEWARRRREFGAWNYSTNRDVLDKFFADGIRRMKDTEDVVTIGMRGDGDTEMDDSGNIELMRTIIASQREIIERETGRPASDTPQVWALYKEVLDYYDRGLRPPDDVTILLCDDNWGNVRRLPGEEERRRRGGWGLYYHFDYVGAPRNSKFFNVTSAISQWEQLSLAYEWGVDRMWIVNVGDLKMQEYPIALFMDMAWDPRRYTPSTLHSFTEDFAASLFGESEAREAARILDTTSRWAARRTPEMLDAASFDLESGEWARVAGDYATLAADARRQYKRLPKVARAAYFELVLFHVSVMANLYEMYYSQAMNLSLAEKGAGEDEVNAWAEKCEAAFRRHAELCDMYDYSLKDGKWNGFARQKLIGYTSWNDGFTADKCPRLEWKGAEKHRREAASGKLAWLENAEPRIYSAQRSQSYDKDMGENWWMRRHNAILECLKTQKEFDIVLCGDSLTHRWERHGKYAYRAVTNELRVLNLGFGADTVKNLLWRLRSGELDGYKAKAVQLMIGTNNGVDEPPEETAAQIRACIREIAARQPNARILLCPILPRGNPDSVERGKNNAVNELLKPLCDGEKIVWTDWADVFLLPDGRLDGELTDDYLHPNAKGYAKWAKAAIGVWKGASRKPKGVAARQVVRGDAHKPRASALNGVVNIEASDYSEASAPAGYRWEFLPGLGYGAGAMEVFPRLRSSAPAYLAYKVKVPENAVSLNVTVTCRSTLPFARPAGHRYEVAIKNGASHLVNYNSRLNEEPRNIYSVFYPTVAKRIVKSTVVFDSLPSSDPDGTLTLLLKPIEPAVAFERLSLDWGCATKCAK